jgi:hypothetical protein
MHFWNKIKKELPEQFLFFLWASTFRRGKYSPASKSNSVAKVWLCPTHFNPAQLFGLLYFSPCCSVPFTVFSPSITGKNSCHNPPMHQPPSNLSTMHILTNTPSSHSTKKSKAEKDKKRVQTLWPPLILASATQLELLVRTRLHAPNLHLLPRTLSLPLSPPTHSRARHTNAQNPNFSVPGTLTFLAFSASKKLVSWMLRQKKKQD